jgi:hypothetical protein
MTVMLPFEFDPKLSIFTLPISNRSCLACYGISRATLPRHPESTVHQTSQIMIKQHVFPGAINRTEREM